MDKAILYIHGKGGSSEEAKHYQDILTKYDVFGLDYKGMAPWETNREFLSEYAKLSAKYTSVSIIANSIGAFFAMNALHNEKIEKALFISPIVNMEKLISDMMAWANVSEQELMEKKEINTESGEKLSWKYLCYVRENPIQWNIPTSILYGGRDNLTPYETISDFQKNINASIAVMQDGEHWFHTDKQMEFLDNWIKKVI